MNRKQFLNLTWLLLVLFGLSLPAELPAVEQFPPHDLDIEVGEDEINKNMDENPPLDILPEFLPPEQPFEKQIEAEPDGHQRERIKRHQHMQNNKGASGMILKQMDRNKDGLLGLREIKIMLKKLGISETEIDELASKFMEYDEDDDHALSKEELLTLRNDKPKLLREFLSRKPRFKEKFDFNQDGTIDEHEWNQIREARKRFSDRRNMPQDRFGDHGTPRMPRRRPGQDDCLPGTQRSYPKGNFTHGSRPSGTRQSSSPAQVAAQIHENIVKVFQTTARRLEKAGDLNRALIVQAKLAEVEVHLAKALIRIQEKNCDEAVKELNNIIGVAKSLPNIGPLPEIQKQEEEEKQEQ